MKTVPVVFVNGLINGEPISDSLLGGRTKVYPFGISHTNEIVAAAIGCDNGKQPGLWYCAVGGLGLIGAGKPLKQNEGIIVTEGKPLRVGDFPQGNNYIVAEYRRVRAERG